MFRNYLLITFRNLIKNKLYVIVNILGLGVALACCIVAYYNVMFHLDFNKHFDLKHEIYKISITKKQNNRHQQYGITPMALAPTIGTSIPGVKEIIRYSNPRLSVRYGEKIFNKRFGFTDKNFFKAFNFKFIRGSEDALQDKNSLMINDELAKQCFGDDDPIGKILTVYNNDGKEFSFVVRAVYEKLPNNSSIRCQAMGQIEKYVDMHNLNELNWRTWASATFMHIPDPGRVPVVKSELKKYVKIQNDIRKDWLISSFYIEPLKDIPSTHRDIWNNSLQPGLHPAAFYAPPIMALIVLIMACLGFMNTALATSSSRLKEIGIRKTMGSIRRHTIIQFLGENLFVCFLGLLLALLISPYLLSAYCDMWPELDLALNFTESINLWIFLVGLLIFTGILAGAYPAFYISKFNPVAILKGDVRYSGAGLFSKILLVLQFSIAVLGIVSAMIFIQNAHYQNTLDMGYDKDQVIAIPVSDNSKLEGIKNKIVQNPLITKVGISEEHIGWGNYNRTLKWAETKHEVRMFDVGRGYFESMGLKLLKGEHFDMNFKESDRGKAIIVNEKFVKDYGWKDDEIIGQTLWENDTTQLKVIGVVKDFYPYGFWTKINAMALKLGVKKRMRMITVQANIKNLEKVDEYLKEVWAEVIPNAPYGGFYQEERLAEAKDVNKQISKIYNFLALVSILLSLVGLYTLVSLTIIKKTKEIGIRKVLGAPIISLVKIINRDFVIIMVIACINGSVLGYFVSEILMDSIWEYYMDINIMSFMIPVLIILGASILTLTRKVYIAANKNPVESIKYE